uniref:Putative ovule protein n=1 Tax=Solanum chacoense TaxID=4108 RepID=A0A0V0GQA3_SOLCH
MHGRSTIQIDIQTPPLSALAPPGCRRGKVLAGASNLILPTGTVLTLQIPIPSFTDGVITHKYLTLGLFLLLLHEQFHRSEKKNTLWNRVSERLLRMSKDALKEYLRSYSLLYSCPCITDRWSS